MEVGVIINFLKENERRFMIWASEYIPIPKNYHGSIYAIIIILVERNIFTIEKLKQELIKNKITIHKLIFDEAEEYLKEYKSNG